MDKELNELETLVMQVFSPANPLMCVHQIFTATGVPYDKLQRVLGHLRKEGYIERIRGPLGGHDIQYAPTSLLETARTSVPADRCGLMVGLTEEEMMGRVTMLKRMKRLLIVDWHPVIDTLLGDYERNLKRLTALREPVDMEESDCLDNLC